jgi:hypothetical protein
MLMRNLGLLYLARILALTSRICSPNNLVIMKPYPALTADQPIYGLLTTIASSYRATLVVPVAKLSSGYRVFTSIFAQYMCHKISLC